eukprot:9257355-Alexandrium_andersonii.AAC.1
MSASLVGSEMCIRDRADHHQTQHSAGVSIDILQFTRLQQMSPPFSLANSSRAAAVAAIR